MSATTAAYAAQAVKPSARVIGDGPTEEAITLLSAKPADGAARPTAIAALRSATSVSLMLMSANMRLPQGTRNEAVNRYMEFAPDDEPEPDDQGDSDPGAEDENPPPPQTGDSLDIADW